MDDNIYAATKSNLDTSEASNESTINDAFYIVSTKKFLTLFFVTLGTYSVYWYYKNWSQYKRANASSEWPLPRAIFSIFFIHSLFEKVHTKVLLINADFEWDYRSHATTLVVLQLIANLLDRATMRSVGSPVTDVLSVLWLLPLAWQFYRAQICINAACGDPEGVKNSKFTVANYVWMVIGAVFWFGAFYNIFIDQGK